MSRVFNINIGLLGHVDSGKTSLAKALSKVASTASFDKNPQSRERGITMDLGFSSLSVPAPPWLRSMDTDNPYTILQFTFVDCPGHASFIRTVLGGASIIDVMLLVVDVVKGIQTQTSECIIIAELLRKPVIVALNKIDAIPDPGEVSRRAASIAALLASRTSLGVCPVVPVAANPNSAASLADPTPPPAIGTDAIISALTSAAAEPSRARAAHLGGADTRAHSGAVGGRSDLVVLGDHAFELRGRGSVITGTVLRGTIRVGDAVELPPGVALDAAPRRVRSLHAFKQPVDAAGPGDRIGIGLSQIDPAAFERGLVVAAGAAARLVRAQTAVIALVTLRQLTKPVVQGRKLQLCTAHTTVSGLVRALFAPRRDAGEGPVGEHAATAPSVESLVAAYSRGVAYDSIIAVGASEGAYALVVLDAPLTVLGSHSEILGARLDAAPTAAAARLAFRARLVDSFGGDAFGLAAGAAPPPPTWMPPLVAYRWRWRAGHVARCAVAAGFTADDGSRRAVRGGLLLQRPDFREDARLAAAAARGASVICDGLSETAVSAAVSRFVGLLVLLVPPSVVQELGGETVLPQFALDALDAWQRAKDDGVPRIPALAAAEAAARAGAARLGLAGLHVTPAARQDMLPVCEASDAAGRSLYHVSVTSDPTRATTPAVFVGIIRSVPGSSADVDIELPAVPAWAMLSASRDERRAYDERDAANGDRCAVKDGVPRGGGDASASKAPKALKEKDRGRDQERDKDAKPPREKHDRKEKDSKASKGDREAVRDMDKVKDGSKKKKEVDKRSKKESKDDSVKDGKDSKKEKASKDKKDKKEKTDKVQKDRTEKKHKQEKQENPGTTGAAVPIDVRQSNAEVGLVDHPLPRVEAASAESSLSSEADAPGPPSIPATLTAEVTHNIDDMPFEAADAVSDFFRVVLPFRVNVFDKSAGPKQ